MNQSMIKGFFDFNYKHHNMESLKSINKGKSIK